MATAALRRAMTAFTRPPDPPDADLLRQFAGSRSEAAFAALVRRHGPLVLGVCRRVVPDRHLADDAFQAAVVVLARRAGGIDPTRPLGPWLYGVARRVALRARTMLGKRRKREHLAAAVPDTPRSSPAIDDATAVLDEEIAKLPPAARDAVILCELQGLSRREAAAKLGIAEGTLSSRLASARKALAAKLQARGVVLSAALAGAAVVSPELASAAVGAATGSSLSSVVVSLADGASAMTLFSKLKLTAVAVLFLLLAAGGVGPWRANETAAAPVPKQAPDGVLLACRFNRTEPDKVLEALDPSGKSLDHLKLGELRNVHRMRVSPDGTRLAFTTYQPLKWGDVRVMDAYEESLYVVDLPLAGPPKEPLLKDLSAPTFAWAADGKSLFLSRIPAGTDLRIVSMKGKPIPTETVRLDPATGKEEAVKLPDFHTVQDLSPDGKTLLTRTKVFVHAASYYHTTYLVPLDTLKPNRIGNDEEGFASARFSPDGSRLLGVRETWDKPKELGVFVADVKSGDVTAVPLPKEVHLHRVVSAAWAPDGKRAAVLWVGPAGGGNAPGGGGGGKGNGDFGFPTDTQHLIVTDVSGKNAETVRTFDSGVFYYQLEWANPQLTAPEKQADPKAKPPAKEPIKAPVPPKADPPEGMFLVSKISGKGDLVEVVGTDGKSGGHLNLGELHNVQQARVSPDGKRLAFVRFVPMSGPKGNPQYSYPVNEVYVVDLPVTAPPKEPVMKGLLEPSVAWAADGKSLFVSRVPAGTDMDQEVVKGKLIPKETVRYDVTTNKEAAVKLPDGHVVLDASADGKALLTGTLVWHPQVVARTNYLVPLDTLKPKRIGDEEDGFDRARLSPDGTRVVGTRVAFSRSKDLGLFVADVASGKVEKVAVGKEMTEGLFNGRVMWAPDGKRVAVLWVGAGKKGGGGLPGGGGPGGGARVKTLTVMDATGENARTVCEFADDSVMDVEWADPKLTDPKKADPKAKPPVKEPIKAPVPPLKAKLPPKLDRVPDAPPELAKELAGWDSTYRHGSEEKFAELEKRAEELAKEYTDHDQARIWYTVAHVAGQSDIRKHADRVRKYAERCLKVSRDPLDRGHLYSYLASCEEVGQGEFADRRRRAAGWLLTGYLELLAQELPDEKPELPGVMKFRIDGDDPDAQRTRAKHAAQLAARERAEWVTAQVARRDVLVVHFRNLYPAADADDLRTLAEAKLPTKDDADALRRRVLPAK